MSNLKLKTQCERCGATEKLTRDHIIPEYLLTRMGFSPSLQAKNMQTLCGRCNQAKGNQLDPKNPRTIPLLRYYFQRWVDLYGQPKVRRKYVFRSLPVKSVTPDTYLLVSHKKNLENNYKKQKKSTLDKTVIPTSIKNTPPSIV
jgi:hypothetical protein